jgi:hypothetical protein
MGAHLVCPTWAHICGCKSRRKLVTTNEAKRNCMKVTECGEEAWSVNHEPMNKNRIQGEAKQGERARNREALVTEARRRRCGGCVMKICAPYSGRSRLDPERVTASSRSEESAEVVVAIGWAVEAEIDSEGPNEKEYYSTCRCNSYCLRCPRQWSGRA